MIWILWGLTIWMILLLILFGSDTVRNGRKLGKNNQPAISDKIAAGEHIPGNIAGSSKGEQPDTEPEGTEPEEITGTPEGTEPEEITGTPEPEGTEPEEITGTPEPEGTEPEEITGVLEPEGTEPEEITGVPEPEGTEPEEITGTPEPEDTEPEEITGTAERWIDPNKPMVALTFDDGPYRNNTRAIMELFEQYNGRATFFVVGYHLDVFAEDTIEAYQRGFQIGNHTENHPSLPTLRDEEALEEIQSLNRRLNELGIPGDVMVRPPYGQHTEYLRENLTVPMIGWNVDSQDWISQDADKIYEEIVGKVKDGDIVLLHDLHDVTAQAMQRVVPALTELGFQLVTVEEMFAAKGIEPQAGRYYGSIR